ncbi:hypothetical protein [Fodinibius salsisoli]|uniref:Uncharacterized protein n=1 Tax=Fodinibius salsisoli TaxID=2820877 RepID=A0ABT3PT50_9BACT|nr:hypothetical protein [Fodinibius salsisoli]MCW9709036.1 hypothetical protein [Fodinibius salsisoli]
MTLVLSWIAEDSRKPSSTYIMTDSRISWDIKMEEGKSEKIESNWDYGRKIFAFKNYPDIIGYCGDVLFPTQVISKAVDILDSGQFYKKGYDFEDRVEVIKSFIKKQLDDYPDLVKQGFTILIAGRKIDNHVFRRFILSWQRDSWKEKYVDEDTDAIFDSSIILGSGREYFKKFYNNKYYDSELHNFSRGAATSFSDALTQDNLEERCGGAPQIVAVYNGGMPKIIGTVFKSKRYLLGSEINTPINLDSFQWRDESFQRIKGDKLELIEDAQVQPPLQ